MIIELLEVVVILSGAETYINVEIYNLEITNVQKLSERPKDTKGSYVSLSAIPKDTPCHETFV